MGETHTPVTAESVVVLFVVLLLFKEEEDEEATSLAIKVSPCWHARQFDGSWLAAHVEHVEWQSPQIF